jgi:hypothetical protein
MAALPLLVVGGIALMAMAGRRRRGAKTDEMPELAPYEPQDECDPLDPSTWGNGMLCAPWEGRWVAVPEWAPPPAETPTEEWPCARYYNGYCIEVWDGLRGSMAVGPAHAYKWRITTPDGVEVEEYAPLAIWSYFDTPYEALADAYAYVDEEL